MRHAPLVAPRQGVTLVELLIAIAILGIVSTAVVAVYIGSSRAYQTGSTIAEAQATARRAMIRMEGELRAASKSSLNLAATNDAFTVSTYLPNATVPVDVRYSVDGSGNLIRDVGGVAATVASNVASLTVVDATAETLTIELLVRVQAREATLQTEISFRNP